MQSEDEHEIQMHRRKWLERLADEYIKLETSMPIKNFLPEENCPKWVENLEREVGATMFPAAKLKEKLELTPRRLAAIIGHNCAIAVWLMEWLQDVMTEELQPVESPKLTPEQFKAAEEFLLKLTNEWYPALRRLAKRALASCVDQPYDDMKDFLLSYANAFAQKPMSPGFGGIGNSAFAIYNFMLSYWRVVAQLQSVHHLHQVLVKVFGSHQVGDLKRIEKICQRIGLSYRKPGRPKKQG